MFFRENDQRPETKLGSSINPIYATPAIGKKMHDIRVLGKEQDFNQTEVALLFNVTHQRISNWLRSICAKAAQELRRHPDDLEFLLQHLK